MPSPDLVAGILLFLGFAALMAHAIHVTEKVDKLKAENIKLRLNQMPLREPNGKFKKNA